MSSAPTGTSTPSCSSDGRGDPPGERDAAALDADEQQAVGAGLLLDDLVGQADRRPADLVRGHDLTAAHRSFLGLTGPPWRPHGAVAEGTTARIPRTGVPRSGGSVDVDRHLGRAGPRRAAADREEVRAVQVHDPALLLRAVVVDDPLDAAAVAADRRRSCRAAGASRSCRCRRRWRRRSACTSAASGAVPAPRLGLRRSIAPVASAPVVSGSRSRARRTSASASIGAAERWAASSGPIESVDRESVRGDRELLECAGREGSIGLGAREPARPGSATRARAAVSTDPTTNRLGRTIGS